MTIAAPEKQDERKYLIDQEETYLSIEKWENKIGIALLDNTTYLSYILLN